MTPSKKGLSFVAVRDHVTLTHGTAGWTSTLARLPPEDAEIVGAAVAVGWYPLLTYARLLRAVDLEFGTGDLSSIPRITRFEAERDIPTIHRLLLRVVEPGYVVEKMASLWSRYHTSGRLTIDRRTPTSIDATLRDWGVDEALCAGFLAYCERALELAGARGLAVSHPSCRSRGAQECTFRARWT